MDLDLRRREKYQYVALVVRAGRNFIDPLVHFLFFHLFLLVGG